MSFGVHLPAAATSAPRRCRYADLPADQPGRRWQVEDRERREGCVDGQMESWGEVVVVVGGGGVIFTSLNHIQRMLVVNIWVAGGAQTARV